MPAARSQDPAAARASALNTALEAQHAVLQAQASEFALQTAAAQALADELAQANRALRRALAAAEAATRAAEAANQAKGVFLSMMSHELRTPLNAIEGCTERLSLGLSGPVTDAQQADVGRIRRANRQLTALVADLLNFARLEAGHVEVQVAAVDVGEVVADLELLVGPQLAAKGLAFDHDAGIPRGGPGGPGRPPRVAADPEKVRQILLNLLANAVKFTDPGGRVTLACEVDDGAGDGADGAAGVVRLRVADTGRGIPPDQLAAVFEPFVQVDRHRTPDSQQGVGLGLAISRDLARGMGGDLTAESAPDVGSTFTLTLPAGGAHGGTRRGGVVPKDGVPPA